MTLCKTISLVLLSLALLGCSSDDDDTVGGDDASDADVGPGFGTMEDLITADMLWDEMRNYTTWPSPDALQGFQASAAPHGAFVRYYVNEVAAGSYAAPADGSIIIKENYMSESDDALAAITVMYKMNGYAPEYGNWFWVKYSPDGTIDANEEGVSPGGSRRRRRYGWLRALSLGCRG